MKLKKQYPLYLISNTNDLHYEHVKAKFNLLKHFVACFPSHEVGHRKPDSAMFEHVLKKIKMKPEETVFIDDMPAFVEGATQLGMQAIQFTTRDALAADLKKLGLKF